MFCWWEGAPPVASPLVLGCRMGVLGVPLGAGWGFQGPGWDPQRPGAGSLRASVGSLGPETRLWRALISSIYDFRCVSLWKTPYGVTLPPPLFRVSAFCDSFWHVALGGLCLAFLWLILLDFCKSWQICVSTLFVSCKSKKKHVQHL